MIELVMMKINDNMFDSGSGRQNSSTIMIVVLMVMMVMMMSKTYLKWVRKAKQFDDKEGKVFQFGRGD